MHKLVLKQNEPREQFDEKFKGLFGITFTKWLETAEVTSDSELIEYTDGNIYAGMSIYENGYSVYSNVCYKCGKPAVADYNGCGDWVCRTHYNLLNDEFDEEYR